MTLDLTSFENAIARLAEGLARYQRDISDEQIRDGLIQRFEFTYEISHKMLKRYLEAAAPSPVAIDAMAFADLIRTGNEQGLLLGEWLNWKAYREMRSKTSHTYDAAKALEVVACIPAFLAEAAFSAGPVAAAVGGMSEDLPPIDISLAHWQIVRDILRRHVPGHEVWAFGSRAQHTAKRYSDLDLAVIGELPVPPAVMTELSDAFSSSDLPWKVDIVDWATTGETFRRILAQTKRVVQTGPDHA